MGFWISDKIDTLSVPFRLYKLTCLIALKPISNIDGVYKIGITGQWVQTGKWVSGFWTNCRPSMQPDTKYITEILLADASELPYRMKGENTKHTDNVFVYY